jgi:hypothetical protein
MNLLGTSDTIWPTVPAPDDTLLWSVWGNENWQIKPKYSGKTCPSATSFTTNPTWPDRRRRGKPATNRLSYGTAVALYFITPVIFDEKVQLIKLLITQFSSASGYLVPFSLTHCLGVFITSTSYHKDMVERNCAMDSSDLQLRPFATCVHITDVEHNMCSSVSGLFRKQVSLSEAAARRAQLRWSVHCMRRCGILQNA